MRITSYFNYFIDHVFLKHSCFPSCCKSSEENLIDLEDKELSQRYIALLNKEYSSFIYNKKREKNKFITRTINEWEQLLADGFKNTNLDVFQNKQRHSKFGSPDGFMFCEKFFMSFSQAVYNFINNLNIPLEKKINILLYAIRDISTSEIDFTEEQINFASELYIAILDYMYLNSYIRNSITPKNLHNNIDIHNLFIDGNILYKDLNSYNLNLDNKGPFVFDYNYRSIERCTRAFCYMIHNRIKQKNTRVTLKELKDINAILGGKKLPKNNMQSIKVNHEFKAQIMYMLTIGYISYLVYDGNHWVVYNKQQLESLISTNLETETSLDEFDITTESYRLSKNHFDSKNLIASKQYLKNLDTMCNTGNLHQILAGVDKTCMLKHNFYITNNQLYLNTSYIYNTPKIEVVEKLLNSYYTLLKNTNNKLDIIRLTTWLCDSLESIHPFDDANSRTLFYILLPVLLYENNIWLTRTLYDNWQHLSLLSLSNKYTEILKLCTALPKIDADFTWDYKLSLNEKFRISCAIGDTNSLHEIFKETPSIIGSSIVISPSKPRIKAVEYALLYGHKEVIKLLLSYDQWKPSKQHLINMHNEYKNKDKYYYNQETNDFLEEYTQLT